MAVPESARRRRVVIEGVWPEIDCGRFPIKRTTGERVVVEADVFSDGHDAVTPILRYRRRGDRRWNDAPMDPLPNDRWRGEFTVTDLGRYGYTLEAWVDRFRSWRGDLQKKLDAGQDVSLDLAVGAEMVERAVRRAPGDDRGRLRVWARVLREDADPRQAFDPELQALMDRYPDRRSSVRYPRELEVVVDRERARFGAWYEFFPRSCATDPGRHGTFADAEKRLDYVAGMGFDVVYLPPIHPIGRTRRKGRNNTLVAGPKDPGTPWAIGSEEGGHKSVHPELGTLEDFDRFVERARDLGMEVALDVAFQCSPDHPYVREHPEWFRHRPDGSIQFAENPPKKYEDVYPLDFGTDAWWELWQELLSVFRFWIEHGVRIFRVDNPHTKPFGFWEWLIGEVKADHRDVIFLSEAFTRPKIMYRLAKLGFTQSYTYFAWRNTSWELTDYFTELTRTEVAEYFRPNLWPNTPDILTEALQLGGRPMFITRLVLAATLGASYGIYGPAFELCESTARDRGSEEYLHSEKYEVRVWDLDREDSLAETISLVNRIRKDHPALWSDRSLRFHRADNDRMICYSKRTEEGSDVILTVVNLDPHYVQSGWVELELGELAVDPEHPFQVHDLVTGARYLWDGPRNYVQLEPGFFHLLEVTPRVRTERDFEQFM